MTAFPRSSLHDILDLTTGVLGRWQGRRCQSRTSLAWGRGILPLTHGRACIACLAVWLSICRLSHTCEHFPCSSPEHLPSQWTLALLVCFSLSWCLAYMYFAFLIPACGMLTQAGLPFPYVYGGYPPCLECSANTNIPWFCPHIRFMCVLESVRLVHLVTEGYFSQKKKWTSRHTVARGRLHGGLRSVPMKSA